MNDLTKPLLPIDAALQQIIAACTALPTQRMTLTDIALGDGVCVLATDVRSARAIPAFTNSAMDGYAVNVDATSSRTLRLVGTSLAGHGTDVALAAGDAVAITTGAPLPAGTTAVVMREHCDEARLTDGVVVIERLPANGEHVRRRGEDVDVDAVVGRAGDVLTPARLNLLWSAGIVEVDVVRRPTVAIMASGDELTEIGDAFTDDDVINSNAWAIAAACRRLGCRVRLLGIAADTLDDHAERMRLAADDPAVDVLITIGGVSMGSHDFVRPALQQLGATLSLWKLAMRPGKPLAFGALPRVHGRDVVFFGLPGNPVSALVTFELFVRPALAVLGGQRRDDVVVPRRRGVLADPVAFTKKPGLAVFARATTSIVGGAVHVSTLDRQGSGQISGLADATALCCFAADSGVVSPGDDVEFIPL